MMKSVLAVLLGAASVHAHAQAGCVASSPASPGEAMVWFGSYHSHTEQAQGTLTLTDPEGNELDFSMDSGCEVNVPFPASTADYLEALRTGPCNSIFDMTHPETILQCYDGNPDDSDWWQVIPSGQNANCDYDNFVLESFFPVHIPNAKSGTYQVLGSNGNAVLDPGSGGGPCQFLANSVKFFQLTVLDGLEGCGVVDVPNVNLTTTECGPVPSGFNCPATCNDGFRQTGDIQCFNGTWTGGCSDDAICTLPEDGVNLGELPTDLVGISGVDCGFSTAEGVLCAPLCETTNGTGLITCGEGDIWVAGPGGMCCGDECVGAPVVEEEPPALFCAGIAPASDEWCTENCNNPDPNCPANLCTCSPDGVPTHEVTPCYAVSDQATDEWCTVNCNVGTCPPEHCQCGANPSPQPSPEVCYAMCPTHTDEWCNARCNNVAAVNTDEDCDEDCCFCSADGSMPSPIPSPDACYAVCPTHTDEWCTARCNDVDSVYTSEDCDTECCVCDIEGASPSSSPAPPTLCYATCDTHTDSWCQAVCDASDAACDAASDCCWCTDDGTMPSPTPSPSTYECAAGWVVDLAACPTYTDYWCFVRCSPESNNGALSVDCPLHCCTCGTDPEPDYVSVCDQVDDGWCNINCNHVPANCPACCQPNDKKGLQA